MKGINYVAGVVKTYREAVDAIGGERDRRAEERWMTGTFDVQQQGLYDRHVLRKTA